MFYILTIAFTTGLFVSESLFVCGVTILLTSFLKRTKLQAQ